MPEESNCNSDDGYMPDHVMEELLLTKLKCNLPWSSNLNKDLHTCKSEEEFELYLRALDQLQLQFQETAQKCIFFKWNLKHYDNRDETLVNGSQLKIHLQAVDREVGS